MAVLAGVLRLQRGFCCMSKTNIAGICLIDKGLGCSSSQLLPDSGVGRSERGEGAGAGEGEGVCNVFIFISLFLSLLDPSLAATLNWELLSQTTVWARDQWSKWTIGQESRHRAEQARAGCCLIRIYCVSRSWTALISGYGGRPASATYVLNFVCTFKPASLDPQPLSSSRLPPPPRSVPLQLGYKNHAAGDASEGCDASGGRMRLPRISADWNCKWKFIFTA